MNTFNLPNRYDEKKAVKGVEFPIYDDETYLGTYTLGLFNTTAPHVRVAMDRYNRIHKNERSKPRENMIRAFVEIALLGWDGVPFGPKGGDLPFSKDTAVKLLLTDHQTTNFLVDALFDFSGDVRNFRNDPEATQEEEAKN